MSLKDQSAGGGLTRMASKWRIDGVFSYMHSERKGTSLHKSWINILF